MSDIFLSYLSSDRPRAASVASALTDAGWDVWWDRSILPGKTFDDVIEEELAATSCVVVLWTTGSVRSEWVRTEAAEARERGMLVPALLDTVDIPLAFRRVQAADLTDWQPGEANTGFDELLVAIAGLAGEPTPGITSPNHGEATNTTRAALNIGSDSDNRERPPSGDRAPRRGKWRLAAVGAVAAIVAITIGVVSIMSNSDESGGGSTAPSTSSPGETTPPNNFGDDAELDRLWISCADGDLTGCDDLYRLSPPGSGYEDFGGTCGKRGDGLGDCASTPSQSLILGPGLLCQEVAAGGYGYLHALIYWVREGRPNRMDSDANGIPCETVYPSGEIESIIHFDAGAEIGPGLLCRDVETMGYTFAEALAYWVREGAPARMDADTNGIPCETIYPSDEIATLLQFDQTG